MPLILNHKIIVRNYLNHLVEITRRDQTIFVFFVNLVCRHDASIFSVHGKGHVIDEFNISVASIVLSFDPCRPNQSPSTNYDKIY